MNVVELSVIVPVFNEEENIRPLITRVTPVLNQCVRSWEMIFVNDGSRDGTIEAIRDANATDFRIMGVSFSRNFGKEVAIAAGLDHAKGDAVVIIDADLQHPPETIVEFVRLWREGYKMVYAQRADRDDEGPLKRGFARLFYKLFGEVGETQLPEGAGDFRLLDRQAVEALRRLPERARFSKGLYAWIGFRSVGVPYQVAERLHGSSKWSFRKLFRFAFDGIASFSTAPLRVSTYFGLMISAGAIIMAIYFVLRTLLYGTDVPGFPTLVVSVMFFSGVQLISLGIIGEYVGRIFAEVKRRPLYLVEEIVGEARPTPLIIGSDERAEGRAS